MIRHFYVDFRFYHTLHDYKWIIKLKWYWKGVSERLWLYRYNVKDNQTMYPPKSNETTLEDKEKDRILNYLKNKNVHQTNFKVVRNTAKRKSIMDFQQLDHHMYHKKTLSFLHGCSGRPSPDREGIYAKKYKVSSKSLLNLKQEDIKSCSSGEDSYFTRHDALAVAGR